MKRLAIVALLFAVIACNKPGEYLLSAQNKQGDYGYVNLKGDTIVPFGKYLMCYTDTFKNNAIVTDRKMGMVAIDRDEKILFQVFPFDNGPDYPSDGYFRIVNNGKIGYADLDFTVKIPAQYACAFPFKNGIAQVSNDCNTVAQGEHSAWISNHWFYINKAGVRVKN